MSGSYLQWGIHLAFKSDKGDEPHWVGECHWSDADNEECEIWGRKYIRFSPGCELIQVSHFLNAHAADHAFLEHLVTGE